MRFYLNSRVNTVGVTIIHVVGIFWGLIMTGGEIVYYPRISYFREPLTLFLKTNVGEPVRLSQGEEILVETVATTDRTEITFVPYREGSIDVQIGGSSYPFYLATPRRIHAFSLVNGILYHEKVPVILLANHFLPPPQDRRWEVVRILWNLLHDHRPIVHQLSILFPNAGPFDGDRVQFKILNNSISTQIVMIDPNPSYLERLVVLLNPASSNSNTIGVEENFEQFIIPFSKRDSNTMVIFVVSYKELDYGWQFHELRMMIEWIIQFLQFHFTQQVILMGIRQPEGTKRMRLFTELIEIAAKAHQIDYSFYQESAKTGQLTWSTNQEYSITLIAYLEKWLQEKTRWTSN